MIAAYKGKLTPIEGYNSYDEYALTIIKKFNPRHFDSPLQQLLDNEEHILVKEKLYKIEKTDLMKNGHASIHRNEDGSIEFLTVFHDGGACLGDAILWGFDEET